MAVREGFLALLLAGENYGFGLHQEWIRRTGGRRPLNPGQSYATLDRLRSAGLIESAGTTADGLELSRLTESGRARALDWLGGDDASGTDPWDESLDRVLLVLSLPPGTIPKLTAQAVLSAERSAWEQRLRSAEPADEWVAQEATHAQNRQAEAAIAWLEAIAERHARSDANFTIPFSTERRRRGRPRAHPPGVEPLS